MTAVLRDDVVTTPAAPGRTLQPAPPQAPKRLPRSPIDGDPLVGAATRLLSIPVREVYAVLWRLGLIEVKS